MDLQRRDELYSIYRNGLLDDVLPFWTKNAYDHQFGGIMTCLDRRGKVIDTDKSVWQQGRFAWTMGYLCNNFENRDEWREMAKGTLEFLRDHAFDTDGRMFFHLTREGQPIRKRRYAFSEAFAAIAAGEYAKLTGDAQWRDFALAAGRACLELEELPPKFTGVRPLLGLARPMIDIFTSQILRDTVGLEGADARVDAAIDTIRRYHVKDDIRAVMETVAPDGSISDHIDARTNNPGHAIEGAWFIMNEGHLRGKPEYVELGLKMLDYSWERGWDKEYGGILYYRDVYGHPVSEYWQDMKFWWPHNEVIIASLLAHKLTGESKYEQMHQMAHDWAYSHFPDRECGDWFGYLSRDGRVTSEIKGNMFKGCFHVPRMQIMCMSILKDM